MKITCTKQTWCIKANDVHQRFLPGSDLRNDANLLQFAIWYTFEHMPKGEAKERLGKIWEALIIDKNITL